MAPNPIILRYHFVCRSVDFISLVAATSGSSIDFFHPQFPSHAASNRSTRSSSSR